MTEHVQKTMEQFHMTDCGDRVIVAISGGADSVCLLRVLGQLKERLGITLEAVHVEHGIRGEESLSDQSFVQMICQELEVPLSCYSVDVPRYAKENGMSTEEAARELRYDVFQRVAVEKKAKIALAHHREDNAETILFQLMRGASLTGLGGMAPVRTDRKQVTYIRPFIEVGRGQIKEQLRLWQQPYCTDSTNNDTNYSRNYVRHEILPKLQQVNAKATEHICETAKGIREFRDYMNRQVEAEWKNLRIAQKTKEESVVLSVKKLLQLHPALQKEIILKAMETVCGKRRDLTAVHVEDVLSLCVKQSGRQVHLPYDMVAKREFDLLRLETLSQKACDNIEESTKNAATGFTEKDLLFLKENKTAREVTVGGDRFGLRVFAYEPNIAEIPKKTYTKWLDYDKIKQGFCIRTRQSGDYFVCDNKGHTKKLKNYLVEAKIPVSLRDSLRLLAQEDKVIWLVGGRISEDVKVSEDTSYVIEITYQGGMDDGHNKA